MVSTVGAAGTGGAVYQAIHAASSSTGVDFKYLFNQARVESSLNPQAKASTSSATGLYQFIEQSWLGVVAKHGDAHGLGWAASAITRGGDTGLPIRQCGARFSICGAIPMLRQRWLRNLHLIIAIILRRDWVIRLNRSISISRISWGRVGRRSSCATMRQIPRLRPLHYFRQRRGAIAGCSSTATGRRGVWVRFARVSQ